MLRPKFFAVFKKQFDDLGVEVTPIVKLYPLKDKHIEIDDEHSLPLVGNESKVYVVDETTYIFATENGVPTRRVSNMPFYMITQHAKNLADLHKLAKKLYTGEEEDEDQDISLEVSEELTEANALSGINVFAAEQLYQATLTKLFAKYFSASGTPAELTVEESQTLRTLLQENFASISTDSFVQKFEMTEEIDIEVPENYYVSDISFDSLDGDEQQATLEVTVPRTDSNAEPNDFVVKSRMFNGDILEFQKGLVVGEFTVFNYDYSEQIHLYVTFKQYPKLKTK